jgi:hypothetical protein
MRMQRPKPAGIHPRRRIPEPLHTQMKLAAMAATAALPLWLLAALLPRPLVLPTLCLIAIAGAGIVSFVAWQRGTVRDSQRVTAWDAAGALAFIACAAAILSNPEQVTYLTDVTTTLRETSGRSLAAISVGR